MATTLRRGATTSQPKKDESQAGAARLRNPPTQQRRILRKDPRHVMFHTLTSKGQLTIPHRVREDMGLKAGEKVGFMRQGDDWVLIRPSDLTKRTYGMAKRYSEAMGRTYTIEEETEAYERAVAEEVLQSMNEEE